MLKDGGDYYMTFSAVDLCEHGDRYLLSLQALSIGDGQRLGAVSIVVLGVMEAYKRVRRERPLAT